MKFALRIASLAILVQAYQKPFSEDSTAPLKSQEAFAAVLLRFGPRVAQSARYQLEIPRGSRVSAQFDSSNKDTFLGAQVFDLLSLRTFRRDTLTQYESQNQSEPLRIALTVIGILFSLLIPTLGSELRSDDELTNNVAAVLGTVISGFFFARNTKARKARLEKIENERMLGDFSVLYRGARKTKLRDLRGKNRLVIISGSRDDVNLSLAEACIYRRRLDDARAIVVPVYDDTQIGDSENVAEASGYTPFDTNAWLTYFDNLLRGRGLLAGQQAWIGINQKGSTFGSALGAPRWDELLGTSMQPIGDGFGELPERFFDASEAASEGAKAAASLQGSNRAVAEALAGPRFDDSVKKHAGLLAAQTAFYAALTRGDIDAMQLLWTEEEFAVDDIITKSVGAVVPWLAGSDSFPPEGMRATDFDAVILPTGEGWTTAIERPKEGGTLLATQKWNLDTSGNWRLEGHRYIPWAASGGTAVIALRCDRRGCLLLGREIDT